CFQKPAISSLNAGDMKKKVDNRQENPILIKG
ncbi:MAG: hypothetical protein ACI89D_001499, partial [Bermanella sp.]